MRIGTTFGAIAAAAMLTLGLTGCDVAQDMLGDISADVQQQITNEANERIEQGIDDLLGSFDQGTSSQGAGRGATTTVIRVVDGDTIAVTPTVDFPATNTSGNEHTIRLLGIDTPERNKTSGEDPECGAEEATAYLEGIVPAGTMVTVSFDSRADRTDRYGRSLAYVTTADSGLDLAHEMIRAGFAGAWYPSGEPEPERFAAYADTQTQAAVAGAGAHASCEFIGR